MTVKELIEKLKECPQEYQVEFTTRNLLLDLFEVETKFEYMTILIKFNYG